jgi:ketosteroid isomerase-like protein
MALQRSAIEDLFRLLEHPDTTSEFFDHVADDVQWTVMGTHPLAGTFSSKAEYLAATFGRLSPLMRAGTHIRLVDLYVDGDTAVVEMLTHSVTLEGAPFEDGLCWICRFDGDMIVAARCYLDSAMVTWTVHRNEPLAAATVVG